MINIRNFAIIAHIDHGKSTLSDRIISICGGLTDREMKEQVLDSLDVERERGITVKAQAVCLKYKGYILNLIDTPGHVDFSYEVRRSLSACEGAIVLVDATQGVQAQTLANVRTASKLTLLPVLNKIDLPSSEPEHVTKQIKDLLKIDKTPLRVSSKTGDGVLELLDEIINFIPGPSGSSQEPLQALIVDSWFDQHIGIIMLARVFNGVVAAKTKIEFLSNNKQYRVESVGVFSPKKLPLDKLEAGMTGYIVANIRDIKDCTPGDTICEAGAGNEVASLPGFIKMKPCVFCGIYPVSKDSYNHLKISLEKLQLNDGGLSIQNSNIPVLGSGFRCGFLGLLHLEVVQQRLVEEFDVEIVTTAPGVFYKVYTTTGEELYVEHPSSLPDMSRVDYIAEPWARVMIFTEKAFLGNVIELCKSKRGIELNKDYMEEISDDRYIMRYKMPLSEIIYDFHDKLKSLTQGYGSFEYELDEYMEGDIVPITIIVQGRDVDPLATMIHRSKAAAYGRWVCEQLRESIDRQLFPVAVQAAIGGKIIARETVPATRKDVTAKCYGGDISRKRKLLDKQTEGKKRMKSMSIGSVTIDLQKVRKILSGQRP